jgi:hypothetical protein
MLKVLPRNSGCRFVHPSEDSSVVSTRDVIYKNSSSPYGPCIGYALWQPLANHARAQTSESQEFNVETSGVRNPRSCQS